MDLQELNAADLFKEIAVLTIEKRRLMIKLNAKEEESNKLSAEISDLKLTIAYSKKKKKK